MKNIQLSKDQEEAVRLISESNHNCFFLTGKAGTGKSTVLSQIRGRKMYTALTGLAAYNIGGVTLHSFLSMSPQSAQANYLKVMQRVSNYDFLIIDEVSMLNVKLFEEVLKSLRYAKYQGKLILVGDFKQLPPVTGEPAYKSKNWGIVKTIELTTNHRAGNHSELIDVLNLVREGHISSEVVKAFLAARVANEPPKDYTVLTSTKDKANKINFARLNELDTPLTVSDLKIIDIKSKYLTQENCEEIIEKNTTFQSELLLRAGARVMTIINTKEYINGNVGTILDIDENGTVLLALDDSTFTVSIRPVKRDYNDADNRTLFSYIQYPLILAWATTIHKSQGQTINKLYVDMNNHFVPEMPYVGLSRATNPDTLKVKL